MEQKYIDITEMTDRQIMRALGMSNSEIWEIEYANIKEEKPARYENEVTYYKGGYEASKGDYEGAILGRDEQDI